LSEKLRHPFMALTQPFNRKSCNWLQPRDVKQTFETFLFFKYAFIFSVA